MKKKNGGKKAQALSPSIYRPLSSKTSNISSLNLIKLGVAKKDNNGELCYCRNC